MNNLFFIEGEKFIRDIPANWEIVETVCSESYIKKNPNVDYKNEPLVIKDSLFERVSDTKTPQGIMAVCRKKVYDADEIFAKKILLIVYAEGINDPGNFGTIIRTAHACGADGLFLSENSVDLYNPKVLRASAGSFFHIPVVRDVDFKSFAERLKKSNIIITAAHPGGRVLPYDIDFKVSAAIVIGNEARGLSAEVVTSADYLIKIPMPGGADSLNASVACAVLLYEAVRQRMVK